MKSTSSIESGLNKLFTEVFPAQLPKWFSKIIAEWAWLIVPAIVIVQPGIDIGYWSDIHSQGLTPNGFAYLAIFLSATEMMLQILAVPALRKMQRSGWGLLYYSVFCNLGFGIARIYATEGSIGPIVGMALLSSIFFYFLFQVRPWFKKTAH